MRKLLIKIGTAILIICLSAFSVIFSACGVPTPDDDNDKSNDIPSQAITTTGLNDLREVVADRWDYAVVAGDCLFTDEGYYKFTNILEYYLNSRGYNLGPSSVREIWFLRGEESVYGVYLLDYKSSYEYVAFTCDYKTGKLDTVYFTASGKDVKVGVFSKKKMSFTVENTAYFVSFANHTLESISAEGAFNNLTFADENVTADILPDGTAELYMMSLTEEKPVITRVIGNLSGYTNTVCLLHNYVIFYGGDLEPLYISLYDKEGESEKTAQELSLNKEVEKVFKETAAEETHDYTAEVTSNKLTLKNNTGDTKEYSVSDLIEAVPELEIITEKRKLTPEFRSVIYSGEEVFVTLEKKPEKSFSGILRVNEGIPQVVIKCDYESETFTFAALVDFTGYNVFRVIPFDRGQK